MAFDVAPVAVGAGEYLDQGEGAGSGFGGRALAALVAGGPVVGLVDARGGVAFGVAPVAGGAGEYLGQDEGEGSGLGGALGRAVTGGAL